MYSRRTKEERNAAHERVVAICKNCLTFNFDAIARERENGHIRN